MQWLTGALAFATTMLFFAVVVSTLVEMVHRFFGLREKGLRLMLESLFERVVKLQLNVLEPKLSIDAKTFASMIMENRAVTIPGNAVPTSGEEKKEEPTTSAGANTDTEAKPKAPSQGFLHRLLSASKMTSIPVEMFTQKLADNKIIATSDARLDDIVRDISQKYVAFGAEASEYFRRRARLFSIVLALPVAFLFHVQPYEIARTFISDPDLAEKVAAKNVDLAFDIDRSTKSSTVDGGALTGESAPASDGAAPPVEPPVGAKQSPPVLTPDEQIAQLAAQNEKLKNSIKEWDALGVPIGWPDAATLPVCADPAVDGKSGDAQNWWRGGCTRSLMGHQFYRPDVTDMFWLVVGGLLIGLGAPFWAQAVGALTASRNVSEKIASIVGGDDTIGAPAKAGDEAVAAAPSQAKGQPTAVRTFQVARKAAQVKEVAG